jgi:hypothetical protein
VCRTSYLSAKINSGYIYSSKIYVLSITPMSLKSVCYQMFVITSQNGGGGAEGRCSGVGVGGRIRTRR